MGIKENKDLKKMMLEVSEMKRRIHQTYTDLSSYANTNNIIRSKIWDTSRSTKSSTTSFTSTTKDNILMWLRSPESNSSNLIKESRNMFNVSTQYKRLILYFAGMLTFDYILSPTKIDPDGVNDEKILKSYKSIVNTVENMNLKHELKKAAITALTEDVFYGIEDSNADSFTIVKINPEYCTLDSTVDGCYSFSIDMSQIKEEDLVLYPEIVTTLYKQYKDKGGSKYQEVPTEICWCLKFNETTDYPIPPFASTLPDLADISTYKELQLAKTEIQNYKALAVKVPVDEDGIPLLDWDIVRDYCAQIDAELPDYVGLFATPMNIDSFEFEKSGGLSDVDTVSRATEQFWNSTGTSPLLFGDAKNNTAGALKLAITADESIMFIFLEQCQRLVNRRLKFIKSGFDFKIQFIPITVFNKADIQDMYSKVLTYGYPVKRAACATLGMTPDDVMAQTYLENNILNITNGFIPVQTSHTQSNNNVGRPNTDETDAGQVTDDNSSNLNR